MKAHELRPMPGNNRCQGQPPARKLVRYLREDQVRKKGHKVLDRTKALYGPRTRAYGETKYKNFYYYKFWTEPRSCMVLGLKPMGKPSTKFFYYYKFWTEPRPCMVLGLKPMGKPSTKIPIITSFGQNQGLVWSSDSSLWGSQVQKFLLLQVLDGTKDLYVPRTQAYGETNCSDKKRFEFRKMGHLIKRSGHFIHGLNTLKG